MEISDQRLNEFIALYKSEFGENISREEALERGLALAQLVKLAQGNNENEKYGTERMD